MGGLLHAIYTLQQLLHLVLLARALEPRGLLYEHTLIWGQDAIEKYGLYIILFEVPVKGHSEVCDGTE